MMDELDKRIYSMLLRDGRVSLSSMGRMLGLSHVAVRNRLRNLCEEDLVYIYAGINIEKLGFRIVIVNCEAETHEVLRELMKVFSKCPRVIFITRTTGEYNLMTIMIAEDMDTLNSIVEVCSIRVRKGIRRSEVIIGETPELPKFIPIRLFTDKSDEDAPCGINCGKCLKYIENKCLGCPSTRYYRDINI
ncbi:AsnC family transcriptional regulator [Candidatus Bathyarchaeota archaeon]|nr:AsnC family transcriptional regulator [Candidatus Bathyarchaeota archaeon]